MKENITEQETRDSLRSSDITFVSSGISANLLITIISLRNESPEMVASVEPVASGFVLMNDSDPRYQYLCSLKRRYGLFLKKASVFLRELGDENIIDAVQILVGHSHDEKHLSQSTLPRFVLSGLTC